MLMSLDTLILESAIALPVAPAAVVRMTESPDETRLGGTHPDEREFANL